MRLRFLVPAGFVLLSLASTGARAEEETPEATRQYNSAAGLHNSTAYDLAADEWIEFLSRYRTDPRADRAQHYLGVCYSKQNEHEKALEAFLAVVTNFPEFDLLADTYLNLGATQYNIARAGKPQMYDAAAKTFHALATKFPHDKHVGDAIFYEGECLHNRNQRDQAAEKYRQVIREYPEHAVAAQAMFALAVSEADSGRHEEALATYDDFLEKFAEHELAAEVRMWRSETLHALKRYEEAIREYAASAAAEGFAMADYVTVRQADAFSAMKQYAEAAALYASVPRRFPQSQYADLCHLEAGKKYYSAGDYPKAEEFLGKVIAAGGKSACEAAHWTARSLLKRNRPALALEVVQKILPAAAEGPDAASLLMDQADAIYELPDGRSKSVALYAALAAKHPDSPLAPQAMYMAAFAAISQGDYQAALARAEEFMAAHADHKLAIDVIHVMAESNLLLNDCATAEELYGHLLQQAPGDRDAEVWKVRLGTAMYLQKKYQETITALTPVAAEIRPTTRQRGELLAEAHYRIGRSQVALEQFDSAARSLEASLAAGPKWKLADDAHLALAHTYQQTKDFQRAEKLAQQVISEFPDSKLLDMAHYRLGERFRLGNELKTAVAEYQTVIENWPESPLMPQTLFGLGWTQLGQEDYAGAEETFSTLVEKYPNDTLIPRARYGRGTARRQLEKYAPAIEDLQALLSADSSPAEKSQARHILGLCQKGLDQFAEAVATFQMLLEEDAAYADAVDVYFELGWAQKSLEKEADAAETFALLAEKFPDSSLAADSQYLVGDFAYEQKDYGKAVSAYSAATTKAGKTNLGEGAAYKLGLAHFFQDNLEDALQTFQYQQTSWPQGPLVSDAALMEAECLFKQKRFEEALAAYGEVATPSNAEANALALLHASQAAAQLKQWRKCLELATGCADQFPDSTHLHKAIYQQGWAQQNLDQLEEAVKSYRQVIAKTAHASDEWAARAQFMIGEIQFRQKKHVEAIKSFYKVIYGYSYPQLQADAAYEAARCFEVRTESAKAVKVYRMLIEKFPDSDKVPLAKERIEQLAQLLK